MDTRTTELICKVVDGCATADERREVATMAQNDPDVADALAEQQQAVDAVLSVGLPEPGDAIRDEYWSGVCSRLERRSGWWLVSVGLALVVGYGVYEIITDPGVHTVYRLGMAALIVGLALLLRGALGVRMRVSKSDRYKEVIR